MQLLGDVYDYFLEACEKEKKREKRKEKDEEKAFSEKFIGAFILVAKESEIRQTKTVYDVIDGQQRITTLSLAIAAGAKVMLEVAREIAKLREEAAEADSTLKNLADKANRKLAAQIKKTIGMLSNASDGDKYAPKVFRENEDLPSGDVKVTVPKTCEIAMMSDAEVQACYQSPTTRFFFYLAKARTILWNPAPSVKDYEDALSAVRTGEQCLLPPDKNTSYQDNYELASQFFAQLGKGMRYDGAPEDLPFNEDLPDESQYDPKLMPNPVQDCMLLNDDLVELADDLKEVISLQKPEDLRANELKTLTTAILYVLSYLDFLTKRVSIAVISGNNDTALDLFETMNTAGQPLGSIETFIPEVYQTVAKLEKSIQGVNKNELLERKGTLGVIKDQSIKDIIGDIQSVFGINKNRTGVPLVVIWFSLICFGRKVGKNFSIQRSELKKNFKAFIDSSHEKNDVEWSWKKIYEFVALLSFVGRWWVYCYGEVPNLEESQDVPVINRFEGDWAFINGFLPEELQDKIDQSEIDVLNFCLLFLLRAGQSLSVALIGRYYIQLLKEPSVANLRELVKAAKATAAFTAIWLSGERGSTQYAETQRRTMAHEVDANKVKQDPGKLAYFWKTGDSSGEHVTAEQLQKNFINGYEARYGSLSLANWIDKLPDSELASLRKEVNRFLLLLYWYGSSSKNCYESIGIRKYADKPEIDFLTGEKWNILAKLEIEHIVPREPKDWALDFDPDSNQGKRFLNEVGNTTLLPKKLNVYGSNNLWVYKQRLYDVVCASDSDERRKIFDSIDKIPKKDRNTIVRQLEKLDKEIKKVDRVLVDSVRNIPNWNSSVIEKRTKAIAMIVWPFLSEWLGRPEKFDKKAFEALLAGAVAPAGTSGSAPDTNSAPAPKAKRGRKPKAGTEVTAPSNAVASAPAPDAVPTPVPKARRGRKPKTVAEATATSNTTSDVHESLRPFFDVIPRAVWTKIEATRLTIDNASAYLSIRVEGDMTIVEIGRRGQGRRLRSEKTLPPSVKFEKIPGADRKCVGEVYVFSGTGPEAEKKLVGLVNKRKDRFVEK